MVLCMVSIYVLDWCIQLSMLRTCPAYVGKLIPIFIAIQVGLNLFLLLFNDRLPLKCSTLSEWYIYLN
jgi:hypothetical protein